ncbi:MAG TPA: bifunctional UDP-sugar hydrolase/5'-nucleotidase [Clostridiales bacterium]|nr:bifunctional UDP-sugar hydrolase/5'-nucleotidase [Clostridiales bacterium]HQK73043.1 bifunctional UDP-sugar hydrolase/5'-nucleotidase [Clostridiales bacterium]
MKDLKKLTLLHSNDLHGDFLAKEADESLIGGVSMLSGYVGKVRDEEENTLYVISGDMFRGSLIDQEYQGLSTIEIMNLLKPDAVTLGNHEVDYGVAHLLFLEKCAKFPIINANIYINTNHTRLFKPHLIINTGGMKILFIGLLTEEVLNQTRQDRLIGTFISVSEAAREVGRICNAYRTEDVDFTVLLTHIGFEEDKKLAAMLDPDWGVDIIIGGHSHTQLSEPFVVNGIPIVQAATGSSQIGRFDIVVDKELNRIDSYRWQLIPVDSEHCPQDKALESLIRKYKEKTDAKYTRILTRFKSVFTHPVRNEETQLGNLFSDIFQQSLGVDIMFLGSGSIRKEELGPIVELQDLLEVFPYDDAVFRLCVSGKQLRAMIAYMLRDEAFEGHTEYYQLSQGVHVEYSKARREIAALTLNGEPVDDNRIYTIGLQQFHFVNFAKFFNLDPEEVARNRKPKVLTTSALDVVEEYLSQVDLVQPGDMGRIVILP